MATDIDQIQLYAHTRDAGAFAALMAAYSDMVYATCLRILANRSEAEDATQECFWRLARESAGIRTSVGAWLHRCATNECITRKRRKVAKTHRELAYETTRQAQRAETSQWADVSAAVDHALEELPDELRGVLIGHFLQRRTQAELAQEFQVSPATMSRRIAEGVELIRKRLKSMGVVTSLGLLTLFLTEHAARAAAPSTLVAGLGKLALAGPSAHAFRWGIKAKIAMAMGAAAAVGVAVWLFYPHHPVPAAAAVAPMMTLPETTAATPAVPARTYGLLYRIRNGLPQYAGDDPIAAVRALVDVGPPAVPAIAAELDRSDRDDEQRMLILTLRVIGDRTAVPVLLRALPRLSREAAPYAVVTRDASVAAFLRQHPTPDAPGFAAPTVGLHPARTECVAALQTLTGHRLATGSPSPAVLGHEWAAWYEFQTAIPRLPIEAPAQAGDPVEAAGLAAEEAPFATGRNVRLSPIREVTLDGRAGWDARAYADLDAGAVYARNEGWADRDQRGGTDWATAAGIDAAASLDGKALLLTGDALAVWPVDDVRFDTLPAEVHLNTAVDLGGRGPVPLHHALAGGPETFLFVTREGGRGIMQAAAIGGGAGPPTEIRLRYRLFDNGRAAEPTLRMALPGSSSPARRFTAEREVLLGVPGTMRSLALDLDSEGLRSDAPDAALPGLTPAKQTWLRRWGGDVVVLGPGFRHPYGPVLAGDGLIALPVTPDAWTQVSAGQVGALLARRDSSIDVQTPILEPSEDTLATWVFQTRDGASGVMQALPAPDEMLRVRYKLVQ